MKSLHFCTPLKIAHLKEEETFWTIRTGWIPQIFQGDVIKIWERTTLIPPHKDIDYCRAKCLSVQPIQLKDIEMNPENQEELDRYGKKFHPGQYFFLMWFRKQKTLLN